jgi:type I restriction enzyme R subunit
LDEFCKEFYKKNTSDERIHPIIDVVVNTYLEKLTEEQQVEFKSLIQSYIRLYSYISQISSFGEIHWEKTFVFLRFLNKKLPKGKDERISVLDSVNLDSLRIQMIGESNLSLEEKTGELEPISNEGGKGKDETPMELLSEIIKKVNETYGTELSDKDRILPHVFQKMAQNEELQKVFLGNNSLDVKKEEFKRVFKDEMVDYHSDRLEFYKNVMNPKVFPVLIDYMFNQYLQGRML